MHEHRISQAKKFTPIYGRHRLDIGAATHRLMLKSFQQLKHGSLQTIRSFTNLLAFQEVPASKAFRELQDANGELSFFHLESNKIYQSQLHARPDESFEVRELVDRAIAFATKALVRPRVDILYQYRDSKQHYRKANKDAVTSLIYNFILHRIAHSAFDNKSPDSTSHLMSFEINNTPSGILLRQCSSNSIASGQSTSLTTPDALEISDQLTALLEITQAHIHRSILEIPLRSSSQLKRVGLSNLSGRVISTNSARRAAISNRLEDLGMNITSKEKNVNCFFVDAGQQITSPQQIDKLSKSGIVFLFNDSGPWGDTNSRSLQYPIKHSELLDELPVAAQYAARAQAQGSNVLVVDHNLQHLRRVVTHLESLGVHATSATNDSEAIALFGKHIDLVFIDLHMLRMNRFQTSMARRNAMHPIVPIIALAPSLSPNDFSAALQSGINDIYKKPIDQATIEQALTQHVGYQPATRRANSTAKKPALANLQPNVSDVVDLDLSLDRADNRPALAKEMMDMLVESLPADIEQLNIHFQQQDYPAMGFIAHRIKGACCCCGVPKFEDSIRKLDRLLKSKMVLEAHPSADTQQDKGINAVMTIVNHDADRLIEWHLSHRNALFNQVDDQEQA
ncbi:response regulator [Pseudomonadales bacterium]|nr:response regulator [Gammaproteobacteria bacterium]MDC1480295.1 response regulator [Pseudomonadales bacterium]